MKLKLNTIASTTERKAFITLAGEFHVTSHKLVGVESQMTEWASKQLAPFKGEERKQARITLYNGLVEDLVEAGYDKAYAQEIVRKSGLYLRKSSGNDGRKKNGGKNGNGKAKPITLRGNAKKAYDAVKSLKLTDKQIAELIAALTA